MSNNSEYKALIAAAKNYYDSRPLELRNIRNGKDIFDLVWHEGLINEINLWTYWQGAGVEFPEVMIIGQDFGTCNDPKKSALYRDCVMSTPADRKKISEEYIEYAGDDKESSTDNVLIRLTKKGLGKQYSAEIAGNEKLFMTNLCLGYRTGKKMSGGDVTAN